MLPITNKYKDITMKKGIGAALLVVGIILLIWGFGATDSLSSEFSKFFTGSPSNRAIWLMIGGVASSVFGLVTLLGSSR